jgi:hypothetical protein
MKTSLAIPVEKTKKSRLEEIDFSNLVFGKTISDHMFVADYKNGEWTDLRIEPYAAMEIHPANAALHYGQSIFEGMKAYKDAAGEVLIFRAECACLRFLRKSLWKAWFSFWIWTEIGFLPHTAHLFMFALSCLQWTITLE